MMYPQSTHSAHTRELVGSYVVGFVASLCLTILPYLLVTYSVFTGPLLVFSIVCCAIAQCAVQMVCFLHITLHKESRWNVVALCVIAVIVLILVVGTLWIMHHLAANMTPAELDAYMHKQN